MFAPGADKVGGKVFAFIDVAADFTDVSFFIICFGFGFDITVVVGVGHAFFFGNNLGFGNTADEHTVGADIHILLYLKGEEGINIAGQNHQTVGGATRSAIGKFIDRSATLEAKGFKDLEGGFGGEAVDIHFACF